MQNSSLDLHNCGNMNDLSFALTQVREDGKCPMFSCSLLFYVSRNICVFRVKNHLRVVSPLLSQLLSGALVAIDQ